MLNTLAMILPVLIPSWRFFKTIEPSPRVQWALLSEGGGGPADWQELHPPPATVTALQMLARLFWNADRNEQLFVISCAERIQQQPTAHSIDEIGRRVRQKMTHMGLDRTDQYWQFRLVFVHREQARLVKKVVFLSEARPIVAPC